MLITPKLFFSSDVLTATGKEIMAEDSDFLSVISPSLPEETTRTL